MTARSIPAEAPSLFEIALPEIWAAVSDGRIYVRGPRELAVYG